MSDSPILLEVGDRQVVVRIADGLPEIVWFGQAIDDMALIETLGQRPVPNAALDRESPATLLPSEGTGWPGTPGIQGHRDDGSAWSPRFRCVSADSTGTQVTMLSADSVAKLEVLSTLELTTSGVLTASVVITNTADSSYHLDRVALTIPVPAHIQELMAPEGRWVHEFHSVRTPWRVGALEFANHRGRTSADKPPTLFAGTTSFTNSSGEVWGAHLGWSGNAATRAEVFTDGRRVLQLGELWNPQEVTLAPGASYTSPVVHVATSDAGLNGVSQAFHRFVRCRPEHRRIDTARPVHMNTWEAVYFNHDLDTLTALADRAAEVGAERYILDDGWFHGRRHDRAGLGDWWVDESVWPNGLAPLIDHVTGLGMEFGIWVEPEMINVDSDLYRAHPEWVLGIPGYEPVTGRNQLVLDIARPEVFEYLLGHLDALLRDHDVSYVKWDMNRDHTQAATGERASSRAQIVALYQLIDELRDRHPAVEFESCSSGGSRADLGILTRTDRVWASDSNDALERQRIQSGFLRLLPPELMGAHIGPNVSHTSGRRHSLGFRATTALFGHFGIEWNLLDASKADLAALIDVVSFHKANRELFHTGTLWQVDTADPAMCALGVVAPDRKSAIYSVAQLEIARHSVPDRLRLPGLNREIRYDIEAVFLADSHPGLAVAQPEWLQTGLNGVTGSMVEEFGLQMPALDPESAVVLRITEPTT